MKEKEFEKINPEEISVCVYYYIDDEDEVVLDYEEMVREFENKLEDLMNKLK